MNQANKKEAVERIDQFLTNVKKMKKPAVIFTGTDLRPTIIREVKKVFSGRKPQFISSTMVEKEDIDRVFQASLKEGSLLLIYIDKATQPVVMRRLEQIIEDGHVPVKTGSNWFKVEPVETWQTIVWVNRDEISEEDFQLKLLFANILVVE